MFIFDDSWQAVERPGYLGSKRDNKVEHYNDLYGTNNWAYGWKYFGEYWPYRAACKHLYERSYLQYLYTHPEELKFICSFDEVYDLTPEDIQAGLDYDKQFQKATHIQDIAIRNVLDTLHLKFHNSETNNLLRIRGEGSNGHHLMPGKIPFLVKEQIIAPKISPDWAEAGSIEDFWQNNKFLMVRKNVAVPDDSPPTTGPLTEEQIEEADEAREEALEAAEELAAEVKPD